ncbi:MAG: acetamidase/formamidase family protein [Clostridiales bacterium]|nr:acetamidase/formamidase family protein [Clostridiales bacterium]
MLRISKEHVTDILDKNNVPAAYCCDGDTVVFETRDCYDGSITSEERPYGDKPDPLENPATGPLYINGAKPGDVLKVEILDIVVANQGIMRTSPTAGAFHEAYDTKTARIFPIVNEQVQFDDKLTLTIDPMIGVIGTAPSGEGILTETPDYHGGNMDCNKIVKGSTLYLPVGTEGALLSMGDLHALMGDGEVMICGLEISGEVTVRVSVLKNCILPTPFLVSRGKASTIQSAKTLDEAGKMAATKMFEFLSVVLHGNIVNAGMLMSLKSDMAVCQVVDPLKTVRVELPLEIFEAYGYQIP